MATSKTARRPTADLARELDSIVHQLATTSGRARRASAEFGPLPPSELEVLRLVTSEPGLRVADAADRLAMRASNVSAAARQLTEQGLIERRADEYDGRVTRLHPTALAHANRKRLSAASIRQIRASLDQLSAEDLARLRDAVPVLTVLLRSLGSGQRA